MLGYDKRCQAENNLIKSVNHIKSTTRDDCCHRISFRSLNASPYSPIFFGFYLLIKVTLCYIWLFPFGLLRSIMPLKVEEACYAVIIRILIYSSRLD